nr:reverse transcriptase domain-containing protein [Tanacetum cinerariifolium]
TSLGKGHMKMPHPQNTSRRRDSRIMDPLHRRILMLGRVRAGLILTNPEGMEFTYALRFEFFASNNEAKYEALVAGL